MIVYVNYQVGVQYLVLVGCLSRRRSCTHSTFHAPAHCPCTHACKAHVRMQSFTHRHPQAQADEVAEQLKRVGIRAVAYHAGKAQDERLRVQEAFCAGGARVVVSGCWWCRLRTCLPACRHLQ